MKNSTGKTIGIILSFSSFILSGCFIFSPLHKSPNILISFVFSLFSGLTALSAILYLFDKERKDVTKSSILHAFFSIFASILAMSACLMLITEIIKDVSYVANRGISLFYYIAISLAILTVSYYLCYNSEKGIFRFSVLAFTSFAIMLMLTFSAFITTKSIVYDISFGFSSQLLLSAVIGSISGLFFAADSSAYICCFRKYLCSDDGKLVKKNLIIGFMISFSAIFIYNLVTALIFSSRLTQTISDPDYALVKLIPGIDFTEIISAIRIISFMIKSSVYIFCASKSLQTVFIRKKISIIKLILAHYILIPVTVLILSFFDKGLEYGAFQHLIYPIVILLSIFFVLINCNFKKKNE